MVIDYKPLNVFLQDDIFPLLKPNTLLVHLKTAQTLSKFDLKEGFWQLSIHPEDRYKATFYIAMLSISPLTMMMLMLMSLAELLIETGHEDLLMPKDPKQILSVTSPLQPVPCKDDGSI